MLATQHITLASQFLSDADIEYDAGDIFQASEKLWGAATHVVIAEMQRRGIRANKHATMMQFVKNFAEDVDEPILFAWFKSAEALHSNFYHGWMENHQFEASRDLVHLFVKRMTELSSSQN